MASHLVQNRRWVRPTLGFISLALFISIYQACSSRNIRIFVMDESSIGPQVFSTLQTDTDLVWATQTSQPSEALVLDRFDQITRWKDGLSEGVSLYPNLITGSSILDIDQAPKRIELEKRVYVHFGEDKHLVNLVSDVNVFVSDSYTFVFYVRNIELPTGNPVVIRLFEFAPTDGVSGGILGVDLSKNTSGDLLVTAFVWYEPTLYVLLQKSVVLDPRKGLGLAVRFAKDPGQIGLFVNGDPADQTQVQMAGTPPFLSKMARKLSLHGATYGTKGQFDLAEFAMWRYELRDPYLRYYSKALQESIELGQTMEISPDDVGQGGANAPRFISIQNQFKVCSNCHDEVMSRSAILAARGQDKITPWVTPGDGAGSLLVRALRHEAGVFAMPKNNPKLSEDQIQQVQRWIDQGAH